MNTIMRLKNAIDEHTVCMPERVLVGALMVRAVADASGNTDVGWTNSNYTRCSAKIWFASDSIEPFSFLWCCEVLEMNPDKIRYFMKRVKKPIMLDRWKLDGREKKEQTRSGQKIKLSA